MKEFYQYHFLEAGSKEPYAKYRTIGSPVEIDSSLPYNFQKKIILPSRLEVLCKDNSWQQHPVILDFKNSSDIKTTVFFLENRACYVFRGKFEHGDDLLLENARKISPSLFNGTRENIERFALLGTQILDIL